MHTDEAVVIPRHAMWKSQRVRILHYLSNGNFMVLDQRDNKLVLHRNQLTFMKGKRK